MDLSFLKWPIIIALIAVVCFLLSGSGVDYMLKKFTAEPPGANAQRDVTNEMGLSRLGGYCLRLFRYEKAMNIFETATSRFPDGKNRWYNEYRKVRCAEKMINYKKAADILLMLIDINANQFDKRVPNNDVLKLRREKLVETHELEKR